MNRSRNMLSHNGLAGLFALTLALSVICGSYFPSYSQSSPLPPREALKERIREDIARHLEVRDAPLEHSEIRELYLEDATAAGLTYPELIALYDDEYLAQRREPNPWSQFLPDASWLLALASTASLVYVTLLKSWIEARVRAINNWLYQKLSGTRLFRAVALRKYRTALVENYQDLPMPFLQNRDSLKMSQVYVPLKVSAIRKGEQRYGASVAIRSESTDALKAIVDYRRLMVIGEPGSGKSVLLKYLAWTYGLGKLDSLPDRPIVALLELYRLSDATLDEAKLLEALVKTFDLNQFPNAQNLVRQSLAAGTLMLLLDGLDEISSDVRPHVVGVIRDLLRKFDQCRVVITCRTAIYNDEFSDTVDRKLEVVEFTDQQMRRFLMAWEQEMQQAGKSASQMMAALRERPLILELARNPLLLTLVAYLYVEPGFVLPHSRAEFYRESTKILLEQRSYKGDDEYKYNRYAADKKRRVLQHLAVYIQDYGANIANTNDRRSLRATVVQGQIKEILPSLDLPENVAETILGEITERSGLLMKIDGGERYLFPHLTIQEYFAAAALKDEDAKLISRFEADPAAWREVVKLGCSLAENSTALLNAVYQRDPVTGLECLAEASEIDPALANQIINYFKQAIGQPQADETLARAFGAVAANGQPRGKAVFDFLRETLNDSQTTDSRRAFAAEALSRTNLPKAATALISWYGDSQPIVRMGDLAVPGLLELAQAGRLTALDDLYAIATPDAANALAALLWHEQKTVMGRAAFYLGSLLSRADIEESLRGYALTLTQQQAENLAWIWQPFAEPKTSALPTIAGRIAYLLQHSSLQIISEAALNLDIRLVVPLCTVVLNPSLSPVVLPTVVETLLEQTEQTPQLEQACKQATSQLLARQPEVEQQWKQLMATLPPKVELDVLSRLITQRLPNRSHWESLFEVINYDLRTSWHYRGTLLIAAALSTIAVAGLAIKVYAYPGDALTVGAFIAVTDITWFFGLTLWQGVENSLEPILFSELGFFGVTTFIHQITQVLGRRIVWFGIEAIYKALTRDTVAVAFAVAVTVAVAFASAFAGAGADAFAFAFALAFVGAFVGAVAFAFAFAFADAFAGAVSSAGISALVGTVLLAVEFAGADADADAVAVTVAGAFAVAVAVTVAGAAVGAWYRLKSHPEEGHLRFLAILAFPWFCWLPTVSIFSSLALYDLLSRVSPISRFPVSLQTSIGIAIVAAVWAALWHRGQWLDAKTRNPFHGGALGEALGVKR